MRIEVNTFKKGSEIESRDKVVEEALEVAAAYDMYITTVDAKIDYLEQKLNLMLEIGDVFTALAKPLREAGIRRATMRRPCRNQERVTRLL